MRWSKLQRALYEITDSTINFQIHCIKYKMDSRYGQTQLPRYFITLNKEIIWDYPKDFALEKGGTRNQNQTGFIKHYPYNTDIEDISILIREYLDTPKEELLSKQFEKDYWGLVNILRAADRRIGQRRLKELRRKIHNKAALKIISEREKKA